MGKDQDLLDAARCGNISVVERILNQRAKKSGPLASLRRGPGPNVQDSSGYTPLHHAALNGHKDIVALLLSHDASSSAVDGKGCTPLHLAAWSGNVEIVKLLLTNGSPESVVNHMNYDHESALHSAAQYGHTEIVKLLLQHKCYPSVRNIRKESPLDLASQYGRLETVQCLLNLHPELLNDCIRCHTPVHLASKNGHRNVVKALLDAGFDVNYMTDIGTALHEAAMYGKIEVVKLLLDYGVDVNLVNSRRRTVFDILQDLNTSNARQIEDVIRDRMTLIKLDAESNDSIPAIMPPCGFVTGSPMISLIPEKCSLSDISPPQQFCSPSPDDSIYEIPPPPKVINKSTTCSSPGANDSLSSLTLSQSQDSSFEQISCSSCSPSKCDPTESAIYENTMFHTCQQDSLLYAVVPPPSALFTVKRFSDPLQQNSIYQNVCLMDGAESDGHFDSYAFSHPLASQDGYIPMMPTHAQSYSSSCRPQPPAKPPRKSVSPNTSNIKQELHSSKGVRNNYEYLYLANSGSQHQLRLNIDNGKSCEKMSSSNSCDSEYVDMSQESRVISTYENHEIICANGLALETPNHKMKLKNEALSSQKFSEILPFSTRYENLHRKINSFSNLMPSKSTPALHASRHTLDHVVPLPSVEKDAHVLKPNYLDLKQKRASIQIPTSPTNYQQPPTPDIPPPSPATAATGIHEKICPVNQDNKSKKSVSRDIDTLTDEQLVATIGPGGEIQLTLATDNKCVSTESYRSLSDNPFEGLCRGSIAHSQRSRSVNLPASLYEITSGKQTRLRKPVNIYENVEIRMDSGQKKVILGSAADSSGQNSNRSSLSVMSPFDEKAEWAEIADIMASFGSGIARESMFAENMESSFTQNFRSGSSGCIDSSSFDDVGQWLSSLGLSQYENLLVIHGFDDINFLGGNIIEDQDLEEIGIENADHRQKICIAAQKLPSVQSLNKMNPASRPASVNEWLCSINLQEYCETFANNNITDIDRALKLWEVELNTVLKVTKIGHRRRILASLGDKQFERFHSSADIDLSKLSQDLSELGVDDPCDRGVEPKSSSGEFSETCSNSSRSSLRIRPPTQLMSDSRSPNQPSVVEPQWRHHPDDLINNSCNYMAKYLGSTLVKELRGMESTKKSIQKFRTTSRDLGKIPNIILSISYSGVKFIDAESQQLVCEHEIRNIHCASQDADDLRHFAYITKDHQTHNHYCHVFSSSSVDLASEIILTLGQAFEVAYQIAVQEKSARSNNTAWETQPVVQHENARYCKSGKNLLCS